MGTKNKKRALKEDGVLNHHAKKVTDPIFRKEVFFDPDDLVQVKYEMVRQVTVEGKSISEAAKNFGMTRPTWYQAKAAIEEGGILGLIPEKSGPKTGHKISDEILEFVLSKKDLDSSMTPKLIAEEVKREFSISVHPRTILRAFGSQKKK